VQTINFTVKVRQAYEKGDLDNFLSPRDLGFFAGALNDSVPVADAFEDVIVGKFAERYEEAVRGFWKMHDRAEVEEVVAAVNEALPAPPQMTMAQAQAAVAQAQGGGMSGGSVHKK